MPKPQSLLIVLDVQGVVDVNELKALLDQEPRDVLCLSHFGALPYSRESAPAWSLYGAAVEKLTSRIRQIEAELGRSLDIYVGGRAPLPIFAHLGFSLQRFSGAHTVIQFDGNAWKLFPLSSPSVADAAPFFTRVTGLEGTKLASGRTAVFVDVGGRDPAINAFRDLIEGMDERIADVVELRTIRPSAVTPENACVLASDLVRELPRIPSAYPYSSGLVLFIAGPTVLAFAVGRALTTSVFPSVWLVNGAPPRFEFAYGLPYFRAREPQQVPDDESDQIARAAVRAALIASIDALKVELNVSDLPIESSAVASRLVNRLQALTYEDSTSNEFRLSITEQKLAFGRHLLEGLRIAPPELLHEFARLLVLHELWHVDQEILSSNYQEIGRAGVVLERLDYSADIFAIRSLFALTMRLDPAIDTGELRARLGRLLGAVLFGVEAFDRAVDPARIDPLAERRLRRYLVWHLQIVRARTIKTADDVFALLTSDVTVELAPLRGHLDERFDKIVTGATSSTEVFAVVNGRLARQSRRPGFDPEPVVDAIRSFNGALVELIMTNLVDSHRGVLVPWVI
ncbi:MAG TPA: hypothetical protein VFK05_07370 [Polyangiaceae bacterium]|nr:hypothetical protein [Polyangiaceae bacterium]